MIPEKKRSRGWIPVSKCVCVEGDFWLLKMCQKWLPNPFCWLWDPVTHKLLLMGLNGCIWLGDEKIIGIIIKTRYCEGLEGTPWNEFLKGIGWSPAHPGGSKFPGMGRNLQNSWLCHWGFVAGCPGGGFLWVFCTCSSGFISSQVSLGRDGTGAVSVGISHPPAAKNCKNSLCVTTNPTFQRAAELSSLLNLVLDQSQSALIPGKRWEFNQLLVGPQPCLSLLSCLPCPVAALDWFTWKALLGLTDLSG